MLNNSAEVGWLMRPPWTGSIGGFMTTNELIQAIDSTLIMYELLEIIQYMGCPSSDIICCHSVY